MGMPVGARVRMLTLLAAMAGVACGNWSNDDVAFVHALPTVEQLRVAVPDSAEQAAAWASGANGVPDTALTTGLTTVTTGVPDTALTTRPTTGVPDTTLTSSSSGAGTSAAGGAVSGTGAIGTTVSGTGAAVSGTGSTGAAMSGTGMTGTNAATAACPAPGASEVWGWAKPASDRLNALVEAMLFMVDQVRRAEPTTRARDARSWGPFPDERHPGVEWRVRMTRARDAGGVPTYGYVFEARRGDVAEFTALLTGSFVGDSARTGRGEFTLDFAAARSLGVDDDPGEEPPAPIRAQYDRTGDPRTIDLRVANGVTLAAFDYAFAGYGNGDGWFRYVFTNAAGDAFTVTARFHPDGAGRAEVEVLFAARPDLPFSFSECWDAGACVTRVEDAWAGTPFAPDGISKLCAGGVCPAGACPAF